MHVNIIGMIILLGKHQFTISSVDDAPSVGGQSFTGPAGSSTYTVTILFHVMYDCVLHVDTWS